MRLSTTTVQYVSILYYTVDMPIACACSTSLTFPAFTRWANERLHREKSVRETDQQYFGGTNSHLVRPRQPSSLYPSAQHNESPHAPQTFD